jgi:flagellar motor protein MotB
MIDGAGAAMAAGLSLVILVAGKRPFAPPVAISVLYIRIVAIGCAVLAVTVWWWGQAHLDTADLISGALAAAAVAVALGIAYVGIYHLLCIDCREDTTRYLAGIWRRSEARKVLNGDLTQPPPYGPLLVSPTDARSYFCDSGKNAAFIWTRWSIALAAMIMLFLYGLVILAGSAALSAVWMAIFRLDLTITTESGRTSIDLPDILFEFDRATLRETALPEMVRTAAILKRRGVRRAVIEGHSDGKGGADYNLLLSKRRAEAVYRWLTDEGGLSGVRFTIVGYGASRSRVPNVHADKTDDPKGRAKNRRVEITFDAQAE